MELVRTGMWEREENKEDSLLMVGGTSSQRQESLWFLTCSQTREGRSQRVAKTRDTIVPEPQAREGREKQEGMALRLLQLVSCQTLNLFELCLNET